MNAIALIPARYHSTRLPQKLLRDLGGKTVILRTYEACMATGLFRKVAVVTDAPEIYREIVGHGGQAIMSRREHACGSDRIAEAATFFPEAQIILNVQGDEPFTIREPLEKLLRVFEGPDSENIDVASLMCPLEGDAEIDNPNNVKVVTDSRDCALLFSRSRLPYLRGESYPRGYFRHIGVYAFRRQALLWFAKTPAGPLETAEKLEGLRFIENGKRIKMVKIYSYGVSIDTAEDLARAREMLVKA